MSRNTIVVTKIDVQASRQKHFNYLRLPSLDGNRKRGCVVAAWCIGVSTKCDKQFDSRRFAVTNTARKRCLGVFAETSSVDIDSISSHKFRRDILLKQFNVIYKACKSLAILRVVINKR